MGKTCKVNTAVFEVAGIRAYKEGLDGGNTAQNLKGYFSFDIINGQLEGIGKAQGYWKESYNYNGNPGCAEDLDLNFPLSLVGEVDPNTNRATNFDIDSSSGSERGTSLNDIAERLAGGGSVDCHVAQPRLFTQWIFENMVIDLTPGKTTSYIKQIDDYTRVKYSVTIDPCSSGSIQPTSYSTSEDNHYLYNYQGDGRIIPIIYNSLSDDSNNNFVQVQPLQSENSRSSALGTLSEKSITRIAAIAPLHPAFNKCKSLVEVGLQQLKELIAKVGIDASKKNYDDMYKAFYNEFLTKGYAPEVAGDLALQMVNYVRGGFDEGVLLGIAIGMSQKTGESSTPLGKSASTPTGQKSSPMQVPRGTNTGTIIGERQYTGHALDEMQSEGITPSVVENTIKNGKWRIEGKDKVYYDPVNKIKVVTISETGAVETVTTANNFKATAPNPGPINIPKYPP